MEVKEAARRPQGWMAGAAVYGIFGALLPRIAACPLGWAAALLGMLPAALLPRCSLPGRWQKTLRLIRCVWALEVMALSLNLCAEGLVEYDYTGWKAWCPALLMLVLGWRGSYLSSLALERLGKLMFLLLADWQYKAGEKWRRRGTFFCLRPGRPPRWCPPEEKRPHWPVPVPEALPWPPQPVRKGRLWRRCWTTRFSLCAAPPFSI